MRIGVCLAHNCPSPPDYFGSFNTKVKNNSTYYLSNQTAADELFNEVAMMYGNGNPAPELIQLVRDYFNFIIQNYDCVYTFVCETVQSLTKNFYLGSIKLYECINCPVEATVVNNVCTCPQNQTLFNRTCQCAPNFIQNSYNASQCVCPANYSYNETLGWVEILYFIIFVNACSLE